MQLDWFTVAAEIVNFLILVFLLKKLLYERILNIAEEREQEVASRYEEAEQQRQDAQQEKASYQEQRREIEEKRAALLQEAQQEAEQRRHELLDDARSAVENQQEEWFAALLQEQERFLQKLHRRAGEQVFAVSRRVLSDLAEANLEERVLDVFLDKLQELSQDERQSILKSQHQAQVRSAFPLTEDSRQKIEDVLQEQIDPDLEPQFGIDDDLVCGVALRVNGRQISWNIDSYLGRLEEEMRDALQEMLRHRVKDYEEIKEEVQKEDIQQEEVSSEIEEKIEQKVRDVIGEYTDGSGGAGNE